MRFFRLQDAGISFKKMSRHNSADGGDGGKKGLCVSGRPDHFGGAEGAYDARRPGEVVILEGRILSEIYDGYRITPTRDVARFSWETWCGMIRDESAWDWES